MIKNILSKAFAFFLILCMLIGVVSCTFDRVENDESTTSDIIETTASNANEDEKFFNIPLAEYKIVHSLKASRLVLTLAKQLKLRLDRLGGVESSADGKTAIRDDYESDPAAAEAELPEILLGSTNRRASADAAEQLNGKNGWSVKRVGKRIVIAASNDALLCDAISAFVESCTRGKDIGVVSTDEALSLTAESTSGFKIVENGLSLYPIMYPNHANDELKTVYEELGKTIEAVGKCERQGVRSDILSKAGQYDSEMAEVLIGETEQPESKQGMALFAGNEYGIAHVGKKIIIGGRTVHSSIKAIKLFTDLLKAAKTEDENGKTTLSLPYSVPIIFENTDYRRLPLPEGLTLTRAVDIGDGGLTQCFNEGAADANSFEAYCKKLTDAGYTRLYKNEIGENTYSAYESEKDKTRVFVSLSAATLRVTSEPITNGIYLGEKVTGANKNTLTQMVVSYTASNTNGMGYILRLADNSFVIFDGGFTADAEKLYDFMKSKLPSGEKPHIRLWVLSHMHGDHIQCFREFASIHAKDVILDNVGTAMPDKYTDPATDSTAWISGRVPAEIKKFPGAKSVILRTGEVIDFGDVKLQVMSTYTLMLSKGLTSIQHNDTSAVIRVIGKSESVLLTADIQIAGGEALTMEHGDALKSSYVQVAHHGSIKWPTTTAVYRYSASKYALFPGSAQRFAENRSTPENKYVASLVGAGNIIVADGSNYDIALD